MFPLVGPVFNVAEEPNTADVMWAWLRRDLDGATESAARAELLRLLDEPDAPTFVLVYLGVDHFIDLRGLRVLVEAATVLRERSGALVVVAPPRCLRTIVDITGVGAALPVAETPLRAVEWLRRRPVPPAAHDRGLPPSTSTA